MPGPLQVGDVELYVQDEGPPEGPPVLLLHGFPDSGDLWRFQVPALAGAGYRVIVPDLRGFGRSSKPEAVDAYGLQVLIDDTYAVLDVLGVQRASVVAHDWGAFIGWIMAATTPERVERLVAVSVGHPECYYNAGIEQAEMSWYTLWFLYEGIAETGLRADDWSLFRRWLRDKGDMDRWIAHFEAAPENLTAALNIYRANINPAAFSEGLQLGLPPVTCPVLGIWSDGDDHCSERQMTDSTAFLQGSWQYERIDGASHWMQVDEPDRLNELLLDFLAP